MAQALSDIYNSLNSGGYDAQRGVINQQLGAVDGQTQGVIAGLDQQKTNAFKGIDNSAASRGMFYSGAPIAEEQQYTGGTYLPALANVQTQAQNQKFGLQAALAGVNTAQTGAAQGIYQNQVQNDQQNNYYNQLLAQNAQYNQKMSNAYGGNSGGGAATAAPNPFNMAHDKSGGWAITMNGRPATLAQYAASNGGNVAQYLSQGSAGDRKLAQQMGGMTNPNQIAQFKAAHPEIFGGI